MTDDEKTMSGKMEAEFRRQMRSGQLNRFVGTLPHFSVDDELPDRFVKLLHQMDRRSEGRGQFQNAETRNRQN